ncbi:prolipoprotein diacylglyceryl transferase [Pseudarthrobacter cellobiosi]|uniref:prolipoprotein diacylglyceryl transferase n=1 Tax=Pseudarthrobacter cellobiosi TaxID=2953654 RepID=UPI00208F8CCF|nr:prolipoprotein diacylglyceryl transferase family protein [Pseudarthrobacter sp. HLT1-5]MCO4254474.1 prolipoprotein diacylglyceryl transferase [Pseudarthrobacter sp. HLT1-5]
MTKKRRKPAAKRPSIPVRDVRHEIGYPGWNGILGALESRQATVHNGRPRADVQPGDRAPVPFVKTVPAPARSAPVRAAALPPVMAQTVPPAPGPPADAGHRHGFFDDLEPQGLAATYWIDTDEWEGPGELSVRFTGTKADRKTGQAAERFEHYEDVDSVTPGIGRIAVTSRVSGITGGAWDVKATPVARAARDAQRTAAALPGQRPERTTVHTRFDALAQGPGVHLSSWPLLVALGAVLAVVLQAMFLTAQGIDPAGPVWLTVLANAVGGVGARLWSLALNRQPLSSFLKTGACIQGFLAGALATIIIGALVFGWPVGRILDATAAGLFFGMAVGRPGCFFTGCCYGRPTASRWGLWSSDRRTARRRHPVQLYEAFLSLLIGLGTLPFMLAAPPRIPGLVFVGSVMVYTLGRQLLFPLRVDPRTRKGRILTIVVCTVILGADIVLAVMS